MKMHNETFTAANELMNACFDMNAIADNITYNMADKYYLNAESIFHNSFAHMWPIVADMISEELLKLNARPTRLALGAHTEQFETIAQMMAANQLGVDHVYNKCKEVIDLAEMMEDVEAKIFFEELMNSTFVPYLKQANEWMSVANRVPDYHFDVHFDDYTHFISK